MDWKLMEQNVISIFEQRETNTHFINLIPFWNKMIFIMRGCPQNFKSEHMTELLNEKFKIFPQSQAGRDLTFSLNWVISINTWMMHVVALYLEMIRFKKIKEPCAIQEEMKLTRQSVIDALKDLHYKRYKTIHGTSYTPGFKHHYDRATLTFTDTLLNLNIPVVQISKAYEESLNFVGKDTQKLIDPIRDRFNKLLEVLDPHFKKNNCEEIEPIPKSASFMEYPKSCFGEAKKWLPWNEETPCALPCDYYSYGYTWCPNDAKMLFGAGVSDGQIKGQKGNAYCEKNWNTCYNPTFKDAIYFSAAWNPYINGFKKKKNKNKSKRLISTTF